MNRKTMIGRGVATSVGQIAMSVVATLIATQIYAGLQRAPREAAAKPVASLTSGGKYDARIAGAALPPLPEPARPALSIVDWAITPMHPTHLVADVAWSGLDDARPLDPEPAPAPVPRTARHDVKRVAATTVPAPVVRLAALAQPDPAPAAPVAAHDDGLWSVETSTLQGVASLGGSVVALGGSAIGHIVPWSR